MKKFFSSIVETVKIVVIAAIIVIPIRYFLFQPFFVKGESMAPNFENGDYIIVDEISYRFRQPERGEVIVFKYPSDPSQKFIKRIIGLPGETLEVKGGKITITKDGNIQLLAEDDYISSLVKTSGDFEITLSQDQYFVMGDNRDFSYDSRRFGPLSSNLIIGRAFFRAWPFDSFSKIEVPLY